VSGRFSAYYAPELADPLHAAGSAWLGRDATGAAVGPGPDVDPEVTADARRYGFHATLKPPMALRPGHAEADVVAALAEVTAGVPAFELPPLTLDDWQGFLCLRQASPSVAMQALSDVVVAGLDPLRQPPDGAELSRRRGGGLDPAREANLRRWGYPDVFATWTFHITLSRRLDVATMARVRPLAQAWFEPALAVPRTVASVAVFRQPTPDEPFRMSFRTPLATA